MKTIDHKFVEFIPEQKDMENGVIYISLDYDTVAHNCLCGCGQQVVTPLSPTDWKLSYDGENIWLDPSIGNWGFDCKSHYWIKESRIVWAKTWSQEKIQRNREFDLDLKKAGNNSESLGEKGFIKRVLLMVKSFLGLE